MDSYPTPLDIETPEGTLHSSLETVDLLPEHLAEELQRLNLPDTSVADILHEKEQTAGHGENSSLISDDETVLFPSGAADKVYSEVMIGGTSKVYSEVTISSAPERRPRNERSTDSGFGFESRHALAYRKAEDDASLCSLPTDLSWLGHYPMTSSVIEGKDAPPDFSLTSIASRVSLVC